MNYTDWLLGNVSGMNVMAVIDGGLLDVIGDHDGSSLIPWAKNWCRSHPLDHAAGAAAALYHELAVRDAGGG